MFKRVASVFETKVVNTMIPISAMAQLFDTLVSVLFLLDLCQSTIHVSHSNVALRYGVQMSSL